MNWILSRKRNCCPTKFCGVIWERAFVKLRTDGENISFESNFPLNRLAVTLAKDFIIRRTTLLTGDTVNNHVLVEIDTLYHLARRFRPPCVRNVKTNQVHSPGWMCGWEHNPIDGTKRSGRRKIIKVEDLHVQAKNLIVFFILNFISFSFKPSFNAFKR